MNGLEQVSTTDIIFLTIPPYVARNFSLLCLRPDTIIPPKDLLRVYREIPILQEILLAFNVTAPSDLPAIVKKFLEYLAERVIVEYDWLKTLHASNITRVNPALVSRTTWQHGSSYGAPTYRRRSKYHMIPHDGSPADEGQAQQDSCRKWYASYKTRGLSSGVCGVWCIHGVCVGWHFMLRSEGRNDMFSALLCHWKKAPEIVVYDYACQLATYCYSREWNFFKDTR